MPVYIRNRSGFTLTELLVVLSIIAVLTAAMAMAVRGAQERARTYRTQAQLDKIERILQSEILKVVNERSTVRLPSVGNSNADLGAHPISVFFPVDTSGNNNPAGQGEGLFSRTRRYREEAMRVNLISRFPHEADHVRFDGANPVLSGLPTNASGVPVVPYYTAAAARSGSISPDQWTTFSTVPSWLRRFRSAMSIDATGVPVANGSGFVPADDSTPEARRATSSELLYQVLKRIWIDGQPATGLFRDSEIGDTDNDGVLEILDAWGQPIGYRLQVRYTGDGGIYNFTIARFSTWMSNFQDLNTVQHTVTEVSPDSMSLNRVRAVAYSANVEDPDQPTAGMVWN